MADTTIVWGPAGPIEPDRIRIDRPEQTADVSQKYEQAELAKRYDRLSPVLGQSLRNRLLAFRDAIDAFSYPSGDSPLFDGRLAVKGREADGKLSLTLPDEGEAVSYYKKYSSGFDRNAATDLASGEYEVTMTLGGKSDSLTVDVGDDWTNGDVVQAFADAVNGSELGVRAHVVNQSYAGQHVPGQLATGLSVALSVNASRPDQDVSLSNVKGHLLSEFDFRQADDPVGPAEVQEFQFRDGNPGRVSSFRTSTFDPRADTTINPGRYEMTWSMGEDSGTFGIAVSEGDTWSEVLDGLVSSVNGVQDRFRAEKVQTQVPAGIEGRDLTTEAEYVRFTPVDPKVGERLSLGSNGHQLSGDFSVTQDATSNYIATIGEDQYDALNTGTKVRVSTTDALPGGLSAGTDYYAIRLDPDQYGYRIAFAASEADAEAGNAITLTDAGSGTLSVTAQGPGVSTFGIKTAWPGTDTRVSVDGRDYTVEPEGVLSLDNGRVLADVEGSFPGALPASVVEPMQRMEETLGEAVAEYNNLRSFVVANQDLFRGGLAEMWRGPLAERMGTLSQAGFSEIGERRLLQVAFDDFFKEVVAKPETMRNTVAGTDGLLPDWRKAIDDVLDNEDDWLIPETSITDTLYPPPEPLTETALETKSRLVDLLDDMGTSPQSPYGNSLVNLKG